MMKYFFFLLFCSCALSVSAEVITMDLFTATNEHAHALLYSDTFGDGYYNLTDVWGDTYNDADTVRFIYTNDARFMLSHLPSGNSYGAMSWEGFTLSRISQDTANVFGCVANGGLAGIGTPYVIGYFSQWVTEAQGVSSNQILFDQPYFPDFIYVCQNSNTMEAISYGNVFNAHAFTDQDTLALIISALNVNLQETAQLTYYLAVDGEKNNSWAKIPLTGLGQCYGLSFRMTTTDEGDYGANTPLYFALDGLTVSTEPVTALQQLLLSESITKMVYNNQLIIIRGERKYALDGRCIY